MAKQKTQAAVKVKKKVWVPIIAPKMFSEQIVGETLANSASECLGKVVQANLMTLTGDARKQSINTKLKITEIKDGKAYTSIIGYEVTPPAIKRLVRRKKERIDESLVYQTKDGAKVRIKPFLLTISLTKSSVVTEIRKRLKMFLYKTAAQHSYEDLFRAVIEGKLQKEIGSALSKIYPIKNAEIRIIQKEKDEAKITPPPAIKEKPKDEEEKAEEKDEAALEAQKAPKEKALKKKEEQ